MIQMKESNEYIKLNFICPEDFDSMPCTDKGKFCSACHKEVIDFTKMSYSDIQRVKGDQPKICGIYLPEQIDPSLHPIELPKARSLAFLSTMLISLNFTSVFAQSTVDPKVEQAQGASNAPNLTPEEAKEKAESGQHISMSIASAPEPDSESTVADSTQEKTKRAKKWYWSKRFPFIHKKRVQYHRLMGF